MFEGKHQKIIPISVFIRRLVIFNAFASFLIIITLVIGIAGYHWIAGFGWVDSLLNAAMILSGMGPVNLLTNTNAKIFASAYAFFCGLVFVVAIGIVFSPIVHRMLHKFHIDDEDLQA